MKYIDVTMGRWARASIIYSSVHSDPHIKAHKSQLAYPGERGEVGPGYKMPLIQSLLDVTGVCVSVGYSGKLTGIKGRGYMGWGCTLAQGGWGVHEYVGGGYRGNAIGYIDKSGGLLRGGSVGAWSWLF